MGLPVKCFATCHLLNAGSEIVGLREQRHLAASADGTDKIRGEFSICQLFYATGKCSENSHIGDRKGNLQAKILILIYRAVCPNSR